MKNNQDIGLKRKVVESMIESQRELVFRFKAERDALNEKIKQAEDTLNLLEKAISSGSTDTKRRGWGKNKEDVRQFLENNPTESFASDKIAEALGIARSSALSALNRLKEANFCESINGLWKKK